MWLLDCCVLFPNLSSFTHVTITDITTDSSKVYKCSLSLSLVCKVWTKILEVKTTESVKLLISFWVLTYKKYIQWAKICLMFGTIAIRLFTDTVMLWQHKMWLCSFASGLNCVFFFLKLCLQIPHIAKGKTADVLGFLQNCIAKTFTPFLLLCNLRHLHWCCYILLYTKTIFMGIGKVCHVMLGYL